VCDRLQDGTQRLEADGDIEQVRGVEEIVEVSEHREDEVPGDVEERLQKQQQKELHVHCEPENRCHFTCIFNFIFFCFLIEMYNFCTTENRNEQPTIIYNLLN